ncbi:GTPase RsgA, partial [Bacillus thuringiensis]|uniref:GTPase RsgA n=1 Tax=Bacillus thuringiensis TaxID=1428 RepID=UPI00201C7F52
VYTTSMKNGSGIEHIVSHFQDKITVFAGQSGGGKSSLLNAISPELELKTAGISAHLGRGKHTTRRGELFDINGGLVVVPPGFSS